MPVSFDRSYIILFLRDPVILVLPCDFVLHDFVTTPFDNPPYAKD